MNVITYANAPALSPKPFKDSNASILVCSSAITAFKKITYKHINDKHLLQTVYNIHLLILVIESSL